jgi:hypothetical protein
MGLARGSAPSLYHSGLEAEQIEDTTQSVIDHLC